MYTENRLKYFSITRNLIDIDKQGLPYRLFDMIALQFNNHKTVYRTPTVINSIFHI